MGERPRSYVPSSFLNWCFRVLLLVIITSLVMVVGWSVGWDIRGVDVWINTLVGSVTFLVGVLIGANLQQPS